MPDNLFQDGTLSAASSFILLPSAFTPAWLSPDFCILHSSFYFRLEVAFGSVA
jgi:hypothetical protein